MIKYKRRPGYNSPKHLLEFTQGPGDPNFVSDLLAALHTLDVRVLSTESLWMNNEIWITLHSNLGEFHLSIDTWDLAFIMEEDNQELIHAIDEILAVHPEFEKQIVDFARYQQKP